MQIAKKYFKLFIGIAAILVIAVGVFFVMQSGNLESGNMNNWVGASIERRAAAVKILTGSEDHTDLMVACMDKIATLPDAAVMPVKDAASLCYVGIQLRDNI